VPLEKLRTSLVVSGQNLPALKQIQFVRFISAGREGIRWGHWLIFHRSGLGDNGHRLTSVLIVPVAAVGCHHRPAAEEAGHHHRPVEAAEAGGDGRRAGSWGRGRLAEEAGRRNHRPVEAAAVADGDRAGLWGLGRRRHRCRRLVRVGHILADLREEALFPAGLATTPPMFRSEDIPLPLRRFAFS
jgi:hypothetical protein